MTKPMEDSRGSPEAEGRERRERGRYSGSSSAMRAAHFEHFPRTGASLCPHRQQVTASTTSYTGSESGSTSSSSGFSNSGSSSSPGGWGSGHKYGSSRS